MARQKNTAVRRPGIALLVLLFVVGITSALLLGVLQTTTVQLSAVRNTADYERALYLAGAGVHHAMAEFEAQPGWTGTIGPIEFPAGSGDTYSAVSIAMGADRVQITGTGTSGDTTRRLQVVVRPGK